MKITFFKFTLFSLMLLLSASASAFSSGDADTSRYCDDSGCYISMCDSNNKCHWEREVSYTGAKACTANGCYVYSCVGAGSARSCSWEQEERDPFPDYTREK